MSTYRKLVMIPMEVYHNIIGGVQQQHQQAFTPPPIPMKKASVTKISYKKKRQAGVVRQLLSSITKKQLMKLTG